MPDQESAAPTEAMTPSARRRIAPIIVLVVAAVMGGLFWVLASSSSTPADEVGLIESPLIGRAAPAVLSSTYDDETFDLSRRKGSWVIINFFNSRCVPCIAEHPELLKFVEQQATFPDGAEFYSFVQPPDDDHDVRAFFAERGGDWPIIRDDDGRITVAFGVSQVPETFIIDPDGVVRVRWAGEINSEILSQLVQQQRALYGTP